MGPLWLHFKFTDPAARKWLSEASGVEPVAVQSLLEVESRPRLTKIDDGALLALRGVNCNPGAAPDDMIGIRIWLEQDRVLTTYRRELYSVADVRDQLLRGEGATSAAGVIASLARRLVSRMSDTVDNLEEQIDTLEEDLIEGIRGETRFALANLRRQIIALRRYMAPQREALAALIASKFSWLEEEMRLSLRETSDQLLRHLEDLDAIRERAAVTQEELQNRIAEQQNIRMYVLSIVAAIFLPLGFLTGLLGINVGGIPGAENPASFGIFTGMLVLIVALELAFFRSRKWF
jgi:zinc transporter